MIRTYTFLLVLALFTILATGCRDEDRASGRFIQQYADVADTYPKLYQAVLQRDDGKILSFTDDTSAAVRRQAWRSLAQTPVDSLARFIESVKRDSSEESWFALSMHTLSDRQLRDLEVYWQNNPGQRNGVSRVLGRQGNERTLHFFKDRFDQISRSRHEFDGALAVSRLITQYEISDDEQLKIIQSAFKTDSANIQRAWLYGFYRGASNSLSAEASDSLRSIWIRNSAGQYAAVDQYVVEILGSSVFPEIQSRYDLSDIDVQLGIELAQLIPEIELTGRNRTRIEALLDHGNPHVVLQTLSALTGNISTQDSLLTMIRTKFVDTADELPSVRLQAMTTIASADSLIVQEYEQQFEEVVEKNPYLYPEFLALWQLAEEDEAFLNRIHAAVDSSNTLKSMYAVNALSEWWNTNKSREYRGRVRSITFDALGLRDRGVSYSVQSLLSDSLLFDSDDFVRINTNLKAFDLPGDIEVYQAFGSLYKNRFENEAQLVVDSLAALNYAPLNRSLKQAGWDVDVPEDAAPLFRSPQWNRLWELGRNPVWVLETSKGIIRVRMNTLSAPATVSAIDSLTRAGAYDGVPFHRVVPNFVLQGGDIERWDGFGGPDFTLPTEASEKGYERGAAGIASAGPDTEGSQYFFMHQWKPHLNGRYTLFGNVVEGMDVVDRVVVGDRVQQAYWE